MAHPNTFMRFPGGRDKALSFTFDDGCVEDRRLSELIGKYGLRATFNINSGWFELVLPYNRRMSAAETVEVLDREYIEIACHGSQHADPWRIDTPTLLWDILHDRAELERLFHRPITGYAYPQGAYTPEVMKTVEHAGFEYARAVGGGGSLALPGNLYEFPVTCGLLAGNCEDTIERLKTFKCGEWIWGGDTPAQFANVFVHSYDIGSDEDKWRCVEDRLARFAGHDDVWYATNIEVVRYIRAFRSLVFSLEHGYVYNPSAVPVWIYREGGVERVDPGATASI